MQSAVYTRGFEALLNATQQFDLNSALYNSLTNNIKTCRYLETNNPFPISTQDKSLFLLHVNIRSIYKNLDCLDYELLQSFPYLPDVKCLSETKIKHSILTNLTLPGFEPSEHADLLTNAGGVVVYVAKKFSVNVLNKNELNSECENIWLQISDINTQETFILGVLYRHLGTDIKNFIVAFNDKLSKLNPKHRYYIVGDIIINVNNTSNTNSKDSDAYLNMLTSNGAFLLIDKPTRVTNTSSSNIDHIITNDNNNILYPCIFRSGLTDHFPVAFFVAKESRNLEKDVCRNSEQPIFYRDKSRFDRNLYSDDLNVSVCKLLQSISLESSKSTNNFFMEYVRAVTSCIDQHAPFTLALPRKHKLMKKPWIIKETFTSITRKQKQYVSHFFNGSGKHKLFYKTYANKLTKIKTLAKKIGFSKGNCNSRNDMRKFWGVINSLTPQNAKPNYPSTIIVGNSIIKTPAEIADKFNKHICSIGKKLSDEANTTNPPDFNYR